MEQQEIDTCMLQERYFQVLKFLESKHDSVIAFMSGDLLFSFLYIQFDFMSTAIHLFGVFIVGVIGGIGGIVGKRVIYWMDRLAKKTKAYFKGTGSI